MRLQILWACLGLMLSAVCACESRHSGSADAHQGTDTGIVVRLRDTTFTVTATDLDTESVLRRGDTTITIAAIRIPMTVADTDSVLLRRVPRQAPVYHELMSKARFMDADTVFVYSCEGDTSWLFEGTPLDTAYYTLFQPYYRHLKFASTKYPELYVSARVPLGGDQTAFLLRVPGTHSLTAVDLWVYDGRRERFVPPIRLANDEGDEGFRGQLFAWLVRTGTAPRVFQLERSTTSDVESGRLIDESHSISNRTLGPEAFDASVDLPDSLARQAFDPRAWYHCAYWFF